jgi:hypothetical protein
MVQLGQLVHSQSTHSNLKGQIQQLSKCKLPRNIQIESGVQYKLKRLMYGPIVQFKYHMKSAKEQSRRIQRSRKNPIRTLGVSRNHEDDNKEAMRLIARASFAHSKSDIVGEPLMPQQHHSIFLPKFAYVPLNDVDFF